MTEVKNSGKKGRVILFPVPISDTGTDDVLPRRNVELIGSVKHFIVENVRSARRFIRLCGKDIDINSLSFCELNRHTKAEEISPMLQPIEDGHDVGVISEAGCPAIADPGAEVVAEARRRGYEVVPLVGPSSIILSLMASGFNGQSFAFTGYLPIDDEERAKRLRELEQRVRREHQTQIFIETPYRNNRLLEDLCKRLPADFKLCVAADISGPKERIIVKRVGEWRGEATHPDLNKTPAIFLIYN